MNKSNCQKQWEYMKHGKIEYYNVIPCTNPPGRTYHWIDGGQCFGPWIILIE
jgi:hypothetical protein